MAARPLPGFISLLPQRRLVVPPRMFAFGQSIISALECSVRDIVPSVERWPRPKQRCRAAPVIRHRLRPHLACIGYSPAGLPERGNLGTSGNAHRLPAQPRKA